MQFAVHRSKIKHDLKILEATVPLVFELLHTKRTYWRKADDKLIVAGLMIYTLRKVI